MSNKPRELVRHWREEIKGENRVWWKAMDGHAHLSRTDAVRCERTLEKLTRRR